MDAMEGSESPGYGEREEERSAHALGEVIATAIVTAAVMPFVQTLVKKAADDTYKGVRDWLSGVFQDAKTKRIPPGRRHRPLLIVQDPNSDFSSSICVPTDVSDRAIDALIRLDLEAEIARAKNGEIAKVSIYWDEQAGLWRIDRERR